MTDLPLTVQVPFDDIVDADEVYCERGEDGRWRRTDYIGIRHDNGGIYEFEVEVGLTENCDAENDEVLTGYLVEPYEETITAYRRVKAG